MVANLSVTALLAKLAGYGIGNRVGLGKLAYVSKTAGTFWKSDWPYGIANKRPQSGSIAGCPCKTGCRFGP